jgi:hypothetical protein
MCLGGTTQCGSVCVDAKNDPANCGSCGNACPSGRVCSGGACNPMCAGGTTQCGASCVETRYDPANCGACGVACKAGEVCTNGVCDRSCQGGTTQCGARCSDLGSDPMNCGACGHNCDPGYACVQGACVLGCNGTDCNGRCTDTMIDPANCGACGTKCGPGEVCKAGTCAPSCTGGTTLCAGVCRDVTLDPNNCGACGTACAAGYVCSAGRCGLTCVGGSTRCSGACVDTMNDPANCGACGGKCANDQVCKSGACSRCPGTQTLCGSTCIDTQTDRSNCGACGASCWAVYGSATCQNGTCNATCYGGYTDCPGASYRCYTNTSSDPLHCGSCTNACGANERCISGVCTACPEGQTMCSGYCVDTQTDQYNCGACNRYCYSSGYNQVSSCVGGSCVAKCYSGYLDCNGVASDGCETYASTDRLNCGACGNACLPGQICTAGTCSTCTGGSSVCGNTCLSLSTDPSNCGACGRRCATVPNATGTCVAGTCGIACSSGFLDCDGDKLNGCESSNRSSASCGTCATSCKVGEVCSKALQCETCFAVPLTGALPLTVSGSTTGRADQLDTACSASGAPDVAYSFTAPKAGTYTFDTAGTTFYAAIEIRSGDCSGPSLGCKYGYSAGTTLSLYLSAGQTVTVVIDGYWQGEAGAYTLTVR